MIRHAVRSFPEAAIAEALDVIVLERTDEPMAGDNPMGRDVRTALNKALQHERGLPAITPGQMPRLFGRLGAFLQAARDAPSPFASRPDDGGDDAVQPGTYPPPTLTAIRFWGT